MIVMMRKMMANSVPALLVAPAPVRMRPITRNARLVPAGRTAAITAIMMTAMITMTAMTAAITVAGMRLRMISTLMTSPILAVLAVLAA